MGPLATKLPTSKKWSRCLLWTTGYLKLTSLLGDSRDQNDVKPKCILFAYGFEMLLDPEDVTCGGDLCRVTIGSVGIS